MKLIHLSDLHAGDRKSDEYRSLRKLVAHIIEHHADAVVTVTGDFTDNGTPDEFDAVCGLLQPLVNHCRLVLLTPGNHDVEWMGTLGRVDRAPFAAFRRGLTKAETGYPYAMEIDGVQLVLIDTTAKAGGAEDLACGRVGYTQRRLLAKYLEIGEPHTRIVCGHHKLHDDDPTTLLKDAEAVKGVLSERCDIYIHGHEHKWGIWRRVDGIGWLADAGKSTRKTASGKLRFRIFEITPDGIDCHVERIEL